MLSPGLLSLKKTNSGNDYLYLACDFFQISGAITTLTESGCIITTLENKSLVIDSKGVYEGSQKIQSTEFIDESIYLSSQALTQMGYQISVDTSEMLISISHISGLPIDKRNKLLSENIIGRPAEIKKTSYRENFTFNRFQIEGYSSPSRKGSVIEGDFDLLSGEFIFKQCDEICLSYINWKKSWKRSGHTIDLYVGNYDLFYFPGRWQRLQTSTVVEINKKSTKQRFSLDYGATTDYFIYRNGILIRRGRGTLNDIEVDLSEENYFSQYTIKVIDRNGRIQTFDLYNGLGLLDAGDYSLAGGHDSTNYSFLNGQLGVVKNFNIMGGAVNSPFKNEKFLIKRAKMALKHLRLEAGELSNHTNERQNYYEQGELSYSFASYLYNRRKDIFEERDNIQHTLLLSPSGGLIQYQHRIRDKVFFENEYLLGKQIKEYFFYVNYTKFSDNAEKKGLNVSGAKEQLNYDLGVYDFNQQIGYFALLSGTKKQWRFTGNLDVKPEITTLTSRLDWIKHNKNLYATLNHSRDKTELGLGLVYSFFPGYHNLDLKRQAQSLIVLEIFLDQNNNGIKDDDELALEGIRGSLVNKNNSKQTDERGKMYFEIDSSFNSVVFSFDEGSFKEMYHLPPKENLRLELNPRKVNAFSVPVRINGMVLLNCSTDFKIKNLIIEQNGKTLQSFSKCETPVVVDQLSPGEIKLTYIKNKKNVERLISINKQGHYFSDIEF